MSVDITPLDIARECLSTDWLGAGLGAKPTSKYGCSKPVHVMSDSLRGDSIRSLISVDTILPSRIVDDDHTRAATRDEPPPAFAGSWTWYARSASSCLASVPAGRFITIVTLS